MKNSRIGLLALVLSAIVSVSSCKKEDSTTPTGSNNNNNNSVELYTHFKTPVWERKVPCEQMVFYVTEGTTDSTFLAGGTSNSTKFKILLAIPSDSTRLASTAANTKGGIYLAGSDNRMWDSTSVDVAQPAPFYLAFNVPIDESHLDQSSTYLRSMPTENRTYYNQVTSIKYVKSEAKFAIFLVKGNFSLKANNPVDNTVQPQIISGDYTYQVGVLRK